MQARTKQTTQMLNYAMDASARMRILVSADERLHQPGRARKEKIFLLLFTVILFFMVHCCKKQRRFSGLKKLDSRSF